MKLTPWFAGDEKPARVGVYERDTSKHKLLIGRISVYSFWNGRRWSIAGVTPRLAKHRSCTPSGYQSLPWRGIVKE